MRHACSCSTCLVCPGRDWGGIVMPMPVCSPPFSSSIHSRSPVPGLAPFSPHQCFRGGRGFDGWVAGGNVWVVGRMVAGRWYNGCRWQGRQACEGEIHHPPRHAPPTPRSSALSPTQAGRQAQARAQGIKGKAGPGKAGKGRQGRQGEGDLQAVCVCVQAGKAGRHAGRVPWWGKAGKARW